MTAPRKPTQPFGYVAFSKDGKVSKHIEQLSEVKAEQENGAFARFVDGYNVLHPQRPITNVRTLDEDDDDFAVSVAGQEVRIQLVELVDRAYTRQLTQEEYDSGRWPVTINQHPGLPLGVDIEARDQALTDLIAGKIGKRYAKLSGSELWLVIFSVSAYYIAEHVEAGIPRVSEGLHRSRAYLDGQTRCVFDSVWFANMIVRPVLVWPSRP